MTKLKVASFGVSLDGFGAGPNQSFENPLGVGFPEVMSWFFPTLEFRKMQRLEGGETGVDNQMAEKGMRGMGAWILGRNMFSHSRGPWPDDNWKGWWGDEPPYHVKTFVLTHYAHDPIMMKGGTEFIFVTDGIESALEQARQAANGKDVRVGGGVQTVREYLSAGLIDEMHLAVRPVLLGQGEHLFNGLDMRALGYEVADSIPGERATHVIIRKK